MAYIGGPAPARWGPLGYFGPLSPLAGPVKPPMASKVRPAPTTGGGCVVRHEKRNPGRSG